MAFPPPQIRLKRRRDEEPVSMLYIQADSAQPTHKRRFTDFVFRRLQADDVAPSLPSDVSTLAGSGRIETAGYSQKYNDGRRAASSGFSKSKTDSRGVPIVLDTRTPKDSEPEQPQEQNQDVATQTKPDQTSLRKDHDASTPQPAVRSVPKATSTPQSPAKSGEDALSKKHPQSRSPQKQLPPNFRSLRQFHLSRVSLARPSSPFAGIRKRSPQKSRYNLDRLGAVFVEERTNRPRTKESEAMNEKRDKDLAMTEALRPRQGQVQKKPNVNKAESSRQRARISSITNARNNGQYGSRIVNGKPSVASKNETIDEDTATDNKLIRQMEAFTLEVLGEANSAGPAPAYPSINSTRLREPHGQPSDMKSDTDSKHSDRESENGDYVMETYIRVPLTASESLNKGSDQGQEGEQGIWAGAMDLQSVGVGAKVDIGVINISEEDEELLDFWGEDEEGRGDDWDEEGEEDSNAEDHPGNEYPDEDDEEGFYGEPRYDSGEEEDDEHEDAEEGYQVRKGRYAHGGKAGAVTDEDAGGETFKYGEDWMWEGSP